MQKSVAAEVAKGQLQEYDDFVEFAKSISKSSKFRSMPPPKPLSANLLTEEPELPQYSHEDWIAYLGSDEGWQAYQGGEEVDQGALRDILSLVGKGGKSKGKGYKGKGWDNSKGGWDNSKGSKGKSKGGKDSKGGGKGPPGKGGKDSMAIAITAAHGDTGRMIAQNPRASKESGTYMTSTNNPTRTPIKWLSWSQTLKVQKLTTANNGLLLESQIPSLHRLPSQQQQTASFTTNLEFFLKSV